MRTDPQNPTHGYAYDDSDTEEFHAHHGYKFGCQIVRTYKFGCQMGCTAGSVTLECDTHHVVLTQAIPILLRDI